MTSNDKSGLIRAAYLHVKGNYIFIAVICRGGIRCAGSDQENVQLDDQIITRGGKRLKGPMNLEKKSLFKQICLNSTSNLH